MSIIIRARVFMRGKYVICREAFDGILARTEARLDIGPCRKIGIALHGFGDSAACKLLARRVVATPPFDFRESLHVLLAAHALLMLLLVVVGMM
jgi:hypothetical protein